MRGMSVISSVFDLQDSSSSSSNLEREREVRTLIWFLRERMDGVDRTRRRKSFKELIGFKGMGCCSATWGLRPSTISVRDDDDDYVAGEEFPVQQIETPINVRRNPPENVSDPGCVGQIPAGSVTGMNLATALAVERQFRSTQDADGSGIVGPTNTTTTVGTAPGTPLRVSLMRLLEESDGGGETEKEKMAGEGNDLVCCVCMVRKKGSAFIPCGHTFCRVCSREMWLNRGSCPLCNRSILEILDIF